LSEKLLDDAEAVKARHLDVKKNDIGIMFFDGLMPRDRSYPAHTFTSPALFSR